MLDLLFFSWILLCSVFLALLSLPIFSLFSFPNLCYSFLGASCIAFGVPRLVGFIAQSLTFLVFLSQSFLQPAPVISPSFFLLSFHTQSFRPLSCLLSIFLLMGLSCLVLAGFSWPPPDFLYGNIVILFSPSFLCYWASFFGWV